MQGSPYRYLEVRVLREELPERQMETQAPTLVDPWEEGTGAGIACFTL